MNFGFPNTPYSTAMQEQYMGNVGTNPTVPYMTTQNINPIMGGGCGGVMGMNQGLYQGGCNQVVQQQTAVDIPYYVNYNTHGNTN